MREVFLDEDTIFAPITPNVHSPVSIIRVSGSKAIESVSKIFKGKTPLDKVKTHTIHYGFIVDGEEKIDDVLVSVMRGPNSYTGEDVVEINCHGNPLVVAKIVELLKKQGLRMALPGEFSKRAFLNGKIDLIQAESVNSLIFSNNLSSLKISRKLLDGKLSEKVNKVKDDLLNVLAHLEVLIDHPEEDLAERDYESIKYNIEKIKKDLEEILSKSKKSRFFTQGLKICIAGKTNVGKSSIMNRILGEDRSIVSEIPGTTRDVVKDITSIRGVPVTIFDTAGIRETKNIIEKEGIKRTIESIQKSDVVILVFDVSKKVSRNDLVVVSNIRDFAREKIKFLVLNKIDSIDSLSIQKRKSEILKILKEYDIYPTEVIEVSAKTGQNIDLISDIIISHTIGDVEQEINNILVNNERHYQLIEATIESLENAINTIDEKMPDEFISIGIRDAISYLGEMIGEVTTEDLMDRIFSNFCIGK